MDVSDLDLAAITEDELRALFANVHITLALFRITAIEDLQISVRMHGADEPIFRVVRDK
jgi:hypothetical protein